MITILTTCSGRTAHWLIDSEMSDFLFRSCSLPDVYVWCIFSYIFFFSYVFVNQMDAWLIELGLIWACIDWVRDSTLPRSTFPQAAEHFCAPHPACAECSLCTDWEKHSDLLHVLAISEFQAVSFRIFWISKSNDLQRYGSPRMLTSVSMRGEPYRSPRWGQFIAGPQSFRG